MTSSAEKLQLFADLALARRLERAEACGNAAVVEARAKLFPDSGACWIEVAGAYAMYDGLASPVTQTFGLGMFEKPTATDLEAIENFFKERGAPVFHEVSPLADGDLLPLLNDRGYRPLEFTSVMFRPIGRGAPYLAKVNEKIHVRVVKEHERGLWVQTSARGWSEFTELAEQLSQLFHVVAHRSGALLFLAELDGTAIATGVLDISGGVALLAGASTIPEARRQGAQAALLDSRLRFAAEQDCDIALMGAQPGSASQRNAERNGFRIAYTRIKWRLPG
jgi:GNAT superfamily N-acetyltransferase